jgi:hypothetical protein
MNIGLAFSTFVKEMYSSDRTEADHASTWTQNAVTLNFISA